MKRWMVLATLASPLVLAGCSEHSHYYYGSHPPMVVDDIRERGYRDGSEAARHDVTHQSRSDMEHHGNFRHPPVPAAAFEDYRHAFRAGYADYLHHGGPRDDRR